MIGSAIPPGEIEVDHDSAEVKPGTLRYDDRGRLFQYVKNTNAAASDGEVANYSQVLNGDGEQEPEVTNSRADDIGPVPAGVFVTSVTAGNYTWILVSGAHSAIQKETGTGTDLAVGDRFTADSNDGSAAGTSSENDLTAGAVTAAAATGDATFEGKVETLGV